jgi:hypothetical protein
MQMTSPSAVAGYSRFIAVRRHHVSLRSDVLMAAHAQAVNGVLYRGDTAKRNQANTVFSSINQAWGL